MSYRSSLMSAGSLASKIIVSTFLFSLVLLNSCNEDAGFLGRNLLPPSDDLYTRFYDQSILNTKASLGNTKVTSENSTILLGSMSDSIFGKRKADFMTRFYINPVVLDSGRIMDIDSMVLSLDLTHIKGDIDFKPILRVYELTDTLTYYDTVFYSDKLPDGYYDPGTTLFSQEINPLDSLIKVNLNSSDLFSRLIDAPDSVFEDVLEFGELFKGLYITTDDVTEGGSILYLNLVGGSEINLFYHYQDDTIGTKRVVNLFVNAYTPKVNTYYNDYTNSRATAYMDLPDQQDTLMFISSMAGLDTKIYLEDFETWRNVDTLPVAINHAELIIPVTDTLLTNENSDNYPARLMLYTYDEENVFDYLMDYKIDASGAYFGGGYDIEKNAYIFNIGMHLQSYINGDIDNLNLVLTSVNNASTAERVILNSAYASDRKMELKITYTKF